MTNQEVLRALAHARIDAAQRKKYVSDHEARIKELEQEIARDQREIEFYEAMLARELEDAE